MGFITVIQRVLVFLSNLLLISLAKNYNLTSLLERKLWFTTFVSSLSDLWKLVVGDECLLMNEKKKRKKKSRINEEEEET